MSADITVSDVAAALHNSERTSDTTNRVISGALPRCLERGNWHLYVGGTPYVDFFLSLSPYLRWCRMWHDVAYVRAQGFDRDYDTEEEASWYES